MRKNTDFTHSVFLHSNSKLESSQGINKGMNDARTAKLRWNRCGHITYLEQYSGYREVNINHVTMSL